MPRHKCAGGAILQYNLTAVYIAAGNGSHLCRFTAFHQALAVQTDVAFSETASFSMPPGIVGSFQSRTVLPPTILGSTRKVCGM